MYVVIRQVDTGDVDTLAAFEDETEADELAALVTAKRDGRAYTTWVEYTPVYRAVAKYGNEDTTALHVFAELFAHDPPVGA